MKKYQLLPSLGLLMAGAGLAFGQPNPGPAPAPLSVPAAVAAPVPAPAAGDHPAPAVVSGPAVSTTIGTPMEGCCCCTPMEGCCCDGGFSSPTSHLWVDAEYMMFWIKGGPVVTPLLTSTTTTAILTDPHAGGLNVAGTNVLFGNQSINYGELNGGRVTMGGWLNADSTIGFNARGFLLDQGSAKYVFGSNSDGAPVLSVPLFIIPFVGIPAGLDGNSAFPVSFPTQPGVLGFRGDAEVASHAHLWGTEANGQLNVFRNEWLTVNALVGARYLDLREDLTLQTNAFTQEGGFLMVNGPAQIIYNGSRTTRDTWTTRNQFIGGQVGAETRLTVGKAFIDFTGKCALGTTHEVVNTFGLTTMNMANGFRLADGTPTPAGIATFAGGILNQRSNSGRGARDDFSVVPELEVKVGFAITDNIKATAGYTFSYWTNVARPGDQINSTIDARQVPSFGTFVPGQSFAAPSPVFRTSDFWAQGITFGLEISF